MRILVLDNYDSFTYNIVHILGELDGLDISVIKNDLIKMKEVQSYDKIILSPGPSLPKDAGKMNELILNYYDSKPILGICLGFQIFANKQESLCESKLRLCGNTSAPIDFQRSCASMRKLSPVRRFSKPVLAHVMRHIRRPSCPP